MQMYIYTRKGTVHALVNRNTSPRLYPIKETFSTVDFCHEKG